MHQISDNALMMSIQAIASVIEQSAAQREAATDSEQADYDEVIEAYELVAMELRQVYESALKRDGHLPAYASLMG